ncbi:hypothetical protein pdam_00016039 [Pocillopora damicornis]|uniref:F5/8 type C domain-containing protein n=1 Tax=Pocillopora damicornis TaxID=46731 RepID=A0A3M6UUM0_POCDA|nr:hypothetical protein pdam_00016039 [Pocillopora damicornis]
MTSRFLPLLPVLIVLALLATRVQSTDECTSYSTINDPTRSVSNEKNSEFALCDKGILTSESWVRFTGSGGTVIPNNPPQAHHCGTKSSGWIRGAHPAVAEGVVQRELCYRYNENECGFDSYEISIRNCGSFFVYKPPDLTECYLRLCTEILDECFFEPVGVSSPFVIPDNQMTASSYRENGKYSAKYGRLFNVSGNGWFPKNRNKTDWLQVDLGKEFQVCAVATQGGNYGKKHKEWTTAFKLLYSSDDKNRQTYQDGNGVDVEFYRVGKNHEVDRHKLSRPVVARYIRFYPTKIREWDSLRVEFSSATIISNFKSASIPAECSPSQYQELNEADRYWNASVKSYLACDKNFSTHGAWYRFAGAAGSMMAPYCIPKQSCITHGAGWINGSHPSEAYQLVSTNACFHWGSNCCVKSSPVQIRNCSGYYVYKLQKPETCYYRYCGVNGLYVYV